MAREYHHQAGGPVRLALCWRSSYSGCFPNPLLAAFFAVAARPGSVFALVSWRPPITESLGVAVGFVDLLHPGFGDLAKSGTPLEAIGVRHSDLEDARRTQFLPAGTRLNVEHRAVQGFQSRCICHGICRPGTKNLSEGRLVKLTLVHPLARRPRQGCLRRYFPKAPS